MKIIQSSILKQFSNLTHAFTTRNFGNLAFHVDDDPNIVQKNHENLAKALNYDKRTLVHMKQIHSNTIHIVDNNNNFTNPPTCDALITDKTNTPLMVMVADCTPILFYDNIKKVIAVAHAGRQGAFKNIIKNTLDSFATNYNSKTEDILVFLGASIGVCCYGVGSEIYEEAKKLNLDYAMIKKDKSYYLDITKILKNQLLVSGIQENHIDISGECSCCKNDKYFSYRADGMTGRFSGVIILK